MSMPENRPTPARPWRTSEITAVSLEVPASSPFRLVLNKQSIHVFRVTSWIVARDPRFDPQNHTNLHPASLVESIDNG